MNKIHLKVDNTELAQFMSALFEDVTTALNRFTKELNRDRTTDLAVPNSFFQKMNELKESFRVLANKEFQFDVPGIDSLANTIKELSVNLNSLHIEETGNAMSNVSDKLEKIGMDLAKIKYEDIKDNKKKEPVVNLDLKPVVQKLDILIKSLREVPLQAEVSNFGDIPMVLSQHSAKGYTEATPVVHNTLLTNNTDWYSVSLSGPTKSFILQCKETYDVLVKFSSGVNDPYWTMKAGTSISVDGYVPIIYFKSNQPSVTIQTIEIH